MRYFVSFCVADPVRYQLLFQRTIPGFEPSAESFAISQNAMRLTRDWFAEHGLDRPEVVDLFTAVGSGIAAQQNSNEPGGDRWTRLVDDAALMFVRHITAGDDQPARPREEAHMNTTTTAVGAIRRLERPECTALALREFHRIGELLATLDDADWSRPTDCPDWDVRAVAGHILGMAQTFSSLRQFLSYMPTAARTRHGRDLTDSLTALQVKRTAGLDRSTLITDIGVVGAAAARWRASRRLMRRIPLKQPMPNGTVETWQLGYLLDVILVRDPWMHRVDISRAVGRPMVLTADHDGRIVADVVAEWAGRHGRPFTLLLTGPAGGSYVQGTGGPDLELDAVEFCRILSRRAAGDGLLTEFVPF